VKGKLVGNPKWRRKSPRKARLTAEKWRKERARREKGSGSYWEVWDTDSLTPKHPNHKADPEKKRRRKEAKASRRANR